MKKNFSKNSIITKDFDRLLAFAAVALTIFGLFAVYSATAAQSGFSSVAVQLTAALIGTVLMFVLCFFDYEQLIPVAKYIFVFFTLILLVVIFLGTTGKWGSKSWLKIGGISIQPSELAKIGFIVTFSYHLAVVKENVNKPLVLLGLMLHAAVPIALVLLQPDTGTAIVFVFIFCVMLFTSGISFKYIIPSVFAISAAVPLWYNHLSKFQKNRIRVFLNPDLEPLGSGYNVIQSKIAVGSGGFSGKGYLNGPQSQLGYLPAKSTDFIFSAISEEFGFIGSAIIIAALFFVIFKCVGIALRSDNAFGRYICVGVAAMLFFHTVENIGMCVGLLPVTGIPLPFLSYGGTSLITNLASVGIVLSVSYHNKPRKIFELK